MPTLRSSSREDEVVVPSERQSSLRSNSYSPSRKSARGGYSTPKRPYDEDEDEIEVPPAPKKRSHREKLTEFAGSKKHSPQQPPTLGRLDAGHLGKTSYKASNSGRYATPYPTPEPSSESDTREDSPEASVMAHENDNLTTIYMLPTEILQLVMVALPADKDVTNFALTCKAIGQRYTRSVIRMRYEKNFDPLELTKEGNESYSDFRERKLRTIQIEYATRQALPLRLVCFSQWGKGAERSQGICIEALTNIIMTSNANLVRNTMTDIEKVVGLNHNWLLKYFMNPGTHGHKAGTDLLDYVDAGRTAPHRALCRRTKVTKVEVAVKLCFIHFMLNPKIPQQMTRFVDSQLAAYTCMRRTPLFKGRAGMEINFPWLEHVANFFKWHLRQHNGEGLLTHLMEDLPEKDLPRAWPGKLTNRTQKLGPKWKGAFTYISSDDQLLKLRNGTLEETADDETSEDNEGFQDLTIFNDIAGHEELEYPDAYEQELKSMPKGPYIDPLTREKVTPEYKDFFGLVKAKTEYHLYGRMHSLPPQAGIPGWQRVTMMKEMPDPENKIYGPGFTQLWAYEGVVVPGGQIILGRWWSPFRDDAAGNSYCGPFIFWQVSSEVEKNNTLVALDFLNTVKEKTY